MMSTLLYRLGKELVLLSRRLQRQRQFNAQLWHLIYIVATAAVRHGRYFALAFAVLGKAVPALPTDSCAGVGHRMLWTLVGIHCLESGLVAMVAIKV